MLADRVFGARTAANPTRWAPGGRGRRDPFQAALGLPGARLSAARRRFSRAGCCFWRWAARWRPDGGSAGRRRRRGRPSRSEASGRPSRGGPPAASRGRPAAGALGGSFSGVPCRRRSAVGRLAGIREGNGRSVLPGSPALRRPLPTLARDWGAEGALCGAAGVAGLGSGRARGPAPGLPPSRSTFGKGDALGASEHLTARPARLWRRTLPFALFAGAQKG